MSASPLVAAIIVGALACPALMWWQSRRGRGAACCLPMRAAGRGEEPDGAGLIELRRRQAVLAARVAVLHETSAPAEANGPSLDG